MAWEPIKEVMTEGLRDPKFTFAPGPNLPRPWRFFADPGLLIVLLFTCAINAYPIYLLATASATELDMRVVVAMLIAIASYPLLTLWLAWDSYRWNFPHRLVYVFAVCLFVLIALVFYLYARSGWVMEAQRQARMHKLGLTDE